MLKEKTYYEFALVHVYNELSAIISPLLALLPEEFTPLLMQLSRSELIALVWWTILIFNWSVATKAKIYKNSHVGDIISDIFNALKITKYFR